jgi:hypothetical protein
MNGILARIYRKALGNQLAIAVGSACSNPDYGIPNLALIIEREFGVTVSVNSSSEFFQRWNDLVRTVEKRSSRESLVKLLAHTIRSAKPTSLHRSIASVPISNFIDTTFDRSLLKALQDTGKKPILHDWHTQLMGSWKQSNPEYPNIFFSLPPIEGPTTLFGVCEPKKANPQLNIQVENMREMLDGKDLLLIGISPFEAEFILNLSDICLSYEKAYVDKSGCSDASYWAQRGVMIGHISIDEIIKRLVPSHGTKYSFFDSLVPRRKLIDAARKKQYDAFISYFSGDREFVKKLEQDLRLRGIHLWRDEREIEVGDSMTDKLQQGLSDSYSFIIVLSPETLSRPWVREELRAAYAQRLGGDFKILPVLYKECEIPLFLFDYKYADFRDPRRYHEQLALIEKAIRHAVRDARKKR